MPTHPHPVTPPASLRTLRLTSLAEGTTLLLLVLVAVPLKRLAGWPLGVSVMGPIHGAAFLLYAAMVLQHLSGHRIAGRDAALLLLAAFVPFGALFVGHVFRRAPQAAACATPHPATTP